MKARLPEDYTKAKVNSNVQMTMYDINKQLINQMEPLTEDERAGHFYTTLLPFLDETNNSYYMLLYYLQNYLFLFDQMFEKANIEMNSLDVDDNGYINYSFIITEPGEYTLEFMFNNYLVPIKNVLVS